MSGVAQRAVNRGEGARPFVKWAGGKGGLLPQLAPFFPPRGSYGRYFEPFLGGGAVFFHLRPPQSYLFDLSGELIELYQVVRDDVEGLIEALGQHHNEEAYFYHVRAQDPGAMPAAERAARFIFLNRTCYNGLYRVNRQGQFNVPFGRYKNPTICNERVLRAASAALQTAHLQKADYSIILDLARAGDYVYFDPPYAPLSATANFTAYTREGFGGEEQERLAAIFRELDGRGCRIMLSNSKTAAIQALYQGYQVHEVRARRPINSQGNGRGAITELLVTNYPRLPAV